MMSQRYRQMEAEHYHRVRTGRVRMAAALLFFLVSFAGVVSCAVRLGLTGSVL